MKKATILKTFVVAALIFGGANNANAQLGGLMKKAKKAVESKVEDAKYDAKVTAKDAVKEQAEGVVNEQVANVKGIEVLFGMDNKLIGTYYPSRKEFELVTVHKDGPNEGKHITYTFKDDGAIMGDDGNQKGEIKGDIVSSGNVYNMEVKSNGKVMWENEELGEIYEDGNVRLFNSAIARTSAPMDRKILAFCVYGVLYKADKLRELRKNKDDVLGGYTIKRTVVTTPSGGGSSSGGETILYKGGSIIGKLRADGTVYVGGSNKGQIRPNGSIYVGGSNVGTLRDNGDVLYKGSIIGRIEPNGDIRIKGSIVGKVEANGNIRKGGSIIGQAKNMMNLHHVAIFYFFNFYYNF